MLKIKNEYLLLTPLESKSQFGQNKKANYHFREKITGRELYLYPGSYGTIEIDNTEYTVAKEEDILAEVGDVY